MGVEFDADRINTLQKMQQAYNSQQGQSSSKFAGWLIKKGLAQSESAAQAILVGIIVINIVITILVIKFIL